MDETSMKHFSVKETTMKNKGVMTLIQQNAFGLSHGSWSTYPPPLPYFSYIKGGGFLFLGLAGGSNPAGQT